MSYSPKVSSSYDGPGSLYYAPWYTQDPDPINAKPIDVSPGNTFAIVSSIGVRYKLSQDADLMLDLRGQYYLSDWIDGLNHNLASNKNNDWLVWLNFGYIYYLD